MADEFNWFAPPPPERGLLEPPPAPTGLLGPAPTYHNPMGSMFGYGLPPAVLRSILTRPSYGEGEFYPRPLVFGEPMTRSGDDVTRALSDAMWALIEKRQQNEPVSEPGMSTDAEQQAAALNRTDAMRAYLLQSLNKRYR